MAFMAPELIVPAQYNLEGLVHTRETDIYAFSLVVLQVITLCARNPTIPDICLGPNRRATIP